MMAPTRSAASLLPSMSTLDEDQHLWGEEGRKDSEMDGKMDGEIDKGTTVECDGNRCIGTSHAITITLSNDNNNNNANSNDNNNNDTIITTSIIIITTNGMLTRGVAPTAWRATEQFQAHQHNAM